tara:strand:- start:568 stop:858 length:291 start_codon:yes stop_codon:yes gene_type:complete
MIVRRCTKNMDIVIHKNTKPGMTKMVMMADGTMTPLEYPKTKKYFLWVDGIITQKSDSFSTIENAYVNTCKQKECHTHGRIDIVKHKLVDNKVTMR